MFQAIFQGLKKGSWHQKPPVFCAWNWTHWRWGDPNSAPEKCRLRGPAVICCVGLPPKIYLFALFVDSDSSASLKVCPYGAKDW
jgi:hypothetical protein